MTWIGWTNLGLGLWLVVAAFVLPHLRGTAVVEDAIGGLFVGLAALWSAGAFRLRISALASWTVALAGIWVIMAPWVLHYAHPSASVDNDFVIGIAIVALAAVNMWIKGRRIYLSDHPMAR
ncbi:MAG: SPW repeat protein [Vicinamibacterales bacterium]